MDRGKPMGIRCHTHTLTPQGYVPSTRGMVPLRVLPLIPLLVTIHYLIKLSKSGNYCTQLLFK